MPNDLAVLIPAYRANDTIVRCLRSLAAQTFQGFDVFLLVDGEAGGFPFAECRDIIKAEDRRFWGGAHQCNQGIARTRNDLLAYAQGYKYLAWQDADDESEPERLRLQREYLEANPEIFMVGTWITQVEQGGKERGIDTPTDPAEIRRAYYEGQQAVSGATAMFRYDPVGKRRFHTDLPIGEDTVFNLEVQKHWPLCQTNIPQRLYRYHRLPGGGAVRRYRAETAAGRAVPIMQHMRECVKKYG